MKVLFFLSIFILSFNYKDQTLNKENNFDWSKIAEVKFYGHNNPLDKKKCIFVFANVLKIKNLIFKTTKSQGYFPKGAQNFAKIKFENKKEITIQILPGLPAPIRIIKNRKKIFEDTWFIFDDETAIKWLDYINELKIELNKIDKIT